MRDQTAISARWLFDHRADVLITVVYGCLAYLSFNALADYANLHRQFPTPWGGYAFAVAIDGAVLYAFISFRRAPRLAGLLLVAGAAATYTLQRWHAEQHLHPLVVSGVVPFFMILVTFAWHRIRQAEPDTATPVAVPVSPPVSTPHQEPSTPPPPPPSTLDSKRDVRTVVRELIEELGADQVTQGVVLARAGGSPSRASAVLKEEKAKLNGKVTA